MTLVWFPPRLAGQVAAEVDGTPIGFGKDNAVELDDGQIQRLVDSGVEDLEVEGGAPEPSEPEETSPEEGEETGTDD